MQKQLRKGVVMALFAGLLGFSAFLRIPGSENVKAVQIVALMASGMGLGAGLVYAKILWSSK